MNTQLKWLYTTEVNAEGGRAGEVRGMKPEFIASLSIPTEFGGTGEKGTNPEQLFAAGYAACFQSSLQVVATSRKITLENSVVTARVRLGVDPTGVYGLDVRLNVQVPGLDSAQTLELAHAAHQICPYSHATRGNVTVEITAS
jgi:lipoyl-dependent peroxiredoxin